MRCRFEAVFAGNPKPEITWYYKGVQLQETDNIQIKVTATSEAPHNDQRGLITKKVNTRRKFIIF